ncbi:TonB-dependent receptor [Novosphingobium sp. 9]|uniref:TonB-dependent receptor n=1 Tax=Novosphingobium sp. 9 TaxID=2025349 RepID=UPI0021B60162|nr:TonB-dependent receptor [Novosphingobium sp. 9]
MGPSSPSASARLRRIHTAILTTSCLAAGALAVPAMAQDTAGTSERGLQEIIVTAQKRAENQQDVPIAVTAVSAATLENAHITDTSDLKAVAPSLNFSTAVGGFGLPRIRGVGSTGVGPGIENPVATYIDGVYISSPIGAITGLNDIAQVAVLKGPQGTLFGRNATGGLIQITTRKPSDTPTMSFRVGYGNYDTVTASTYISSGIAHGLAASLAAQYENRGDGFGVNVHTGNPIMTQRSFTTRGKLRWDSDDGDTSAEISADYAKVSGVNPAFRPISLNVLGAYAGGDKRDIDSDIDPVMRSRQYGASLTIDHDFGGASIKSISAYRNMRLYVAFDPDGTTEDEWAFIPGANGPALGFAHGYLIENTQIDKSFTQEVQLLSNGSGPFSWVLGGFYMWSQGLYQPGRSTNAFLTSLGRYTDVDAQQKLNSLAGFAQGTYRLGEDTNFTAGIRYTHDRREGQGIRITYDANGNPLPVQTPPQGVEESYKDTFPKVTWRLSLDHRFSPNVMAYASYNRGFRSAAYVVGNFGLATSITNKVLKPEVIDAYEVGLKTDLFDRRLRFNLAGYYYDQTNVQVMQIQNGIQTIYNAKGAHIYGLDADFQFEPIDHLLFTGGFNWTHARYTQFPNAQLTVPNPAGGNTLTTGDASGNRLQNVPDWTLSVGASYQIGKVTIAGNYYHNDGWAADPDNRVWQPSYDLVDASITWKSDKGLSLAVWGKNLTNQFYFQQLGASNFADNGVQANPRTYGVTLGYDF